MPRYPSDTAEPATITPKDPDSVIDYIFDWSSRANATDANGTNWLAPSETISSYVITSTAGITVDSDTSTSIAVHDGLGNSIALTDNTAVQVWLSGGTAGDTYIIGCRITTSGGRTEEKSIRITVNQK